MTPSALLDPSADALLCKRLVDRFGQARAHCVLDDMLENFTVVELAALAADFTVWGRPKQIPPATDWISFGSLAARGFGKSEAIARFLVGEAQAGRAKAIGGAAQNEVKTIAAQVLPLIAASPPWFLPEWESTAMRLTWPNGARYLGFTPEAPEAIRSENHDTVWMSELQSWPAATRDEAYSNFLYACRIGLARRLWDATPKRGHPILKKLLARGESDPLRHIVRRGTMYENPHLTATAVRELEAEYGGTTKGDEELLGKMLEESERATVKQAVIDAYKRPFPARLARRVIAIDPAVTKRAGSDRTGIIDAGLGDDGQAYVLGNFSGRHAPEAWAAIVLDKYIAGRCDCVVVETNKGGDLVASNLRAAASARGLVVVVLGKEEPARWNPGVVYVREVHARGEKADRAQPLTTAYERGRISHVSEAPGLPDLEDILTSWEPTPGSRSPDALDALVHAIVELLGLLSKQTDNAAGFIGIEEMSRRVASAMTATEAHSLVAEALRGRGGGGWSGSGRI
jgi:phage terminase large subunit-like protein